MLLTSNYNIPFLDGEPVWTMLPFVASHSQENKNPIWAPMAHFNSKYCLITCKLYSLIESHYSKRMGSKMLKLPFLSTIL